MNATFSKILALRKSTSGKNDSDASSLLSDRTPSKPSLPSSLIAKYVHIINKDDQPLFVEVSTGHATWLLPGDATIDDLKIVTYVHDENQSRYFENMQTNVTSWELPEEGMSPIAVSTSKELLKMNNKACESYIKQPFNVKASAKQTEIIDSWVDNLDDEEEEGAEDSSEKSNAEVGNSLPTVAPPPVPSSQPQFVDHTPKVDASQKQQQQESPKKSPFASIMNVFSSTKGAKGAAGSNLFFHILNADSAPVFVDSSSGQMMWTLPALCGLKNLLLATYIAEDSGKKYFEDLKSTETTWHIPALGGVSEACLTNSNKLLFLSNLQCQELLKLPFSAAVSAREQEKVDAWIDELEEEEEEEEEAAPAPVRRASVRSVVKLQPAPAPTTAPTTAPILNRSAFSSDEDGDDGRDDDDNSSNDRDTIHDDRITRVWESPEDFLRDGTVTRSAGDIATIGMLQKEVIKAGMLVKLATVSARNWKKRYFVLTSLLLLYYKDKSDVERRSPAGEFELTDDTTIADENANEHGVCFRVSTANASLVIAAGTQALKKTWVDAIRQVVRANSPSLRDYVLVGDRQAKKYAIAKGDTLTIHAAGTNVFAIESVFNLNSATVITLAKDRAQFTVFDVMGRKFASSAKNCEISFRFPGKSANESVLEWKSFFERRTGKSIASTGSSGSGLAEASSEEDEESAGDDSSSRTSSEMKPAKPSKPSGPLPLPQLMIGGSLDEGDDFLDIRDHDELVPVEAGGKNTGLPLVRILFERFANAKTETISITGLQRLCYEFDMHYEKQKFVDDLLRLHLDDVDDISYEDYMAWWRNNEKLSVTKLSDPKTARKHIACVLFRRQDPACNGWITRKKYESVHQELLNQDLLSSERDVNLDEALKSIENTRGQVLLNTFLNWLNGLRWQKIVKGEEKAKNFSKIMGLLKGRSLSPTNEQDEASPRKAAEPAPAAAEAAKPSVDPFKRQVLPEPSQARRAKDAGSEEEEEVARGRGRGGYNGAARDAFDSEGGEEEEQAHRRRRSKQNAAGAAESINRAAEKKREKEKESINRAAEKEKESINRAAEKEKESTNRAAEKEKESTNSRNQSRFQAPESGEDHLADWLKKSRDMRKADVPEVKRRSLFGFGMGKLVRSPETYHTPAAADAAQRGTSEVTARRGEDEREAAGGQRGPSPQRAVQESSRSSASKVHAHKTHYEEEVVPSKKMAPQNSLFQKTKSGSSDWSSSRDYLADKPRSLGDSGGSLPARPRTGISTFFPVQVEEPQPQPQVVVEPLPVRRRSSAGPPAKTPIAQSSDFEPHAPAYAASKGGSAEKQFSALQRKPVTPFTTLNLTSTSINDFVYNMKSAREEDRKLFSYMSENLSYPSPSSSPDRELWQSGEADAVPVDRAAQTDEGLSMHELYRSPYEMLLKERKALEEAQEKLRQEEREVLERIRLAEEQSLGKLEHISETIASEQRSLDNRRRHFDEEKLKFMEFEHTTSAVHKTRSAEVLAIANAMSKHHKFLVNERKKAARARFHLSYSLQQINTLAEVAAQDRNKASEADRQRAAPTSSRLSSRQDFVSSNRSSKQYAVINRVAQISSPNKSLPLSKRAMHFSNGKFEHYLTAGSNHLSTSM